VKYLSRKEMLIMGPVIAKPKKHTESEKIVKRTIPEGLCEECILAEGCTYPGEKRKRVTLCSEFTGHQPILFKATDYNMESALDSWTRENKSQQDPNAKTIRGLCATCIGVDSCTFPKCETGVWNCDEYKE
jgi:hypothetical protein